MRTIIQEGDHWLCSEHGKIKPGTFETERAADLAFAFSDEVLTGFVRSLELNQPITEAMLLEAL